MKTAMLLFLSMIMLAGCALSSKPLLLGHSENKRDIHPEIFHSNHDMKIETLRGYACLSNLNQVENMKVFPDFKHKTETEYYLKTCEKWLLNSFLRYKGIVCVSVYQENKPIAGNGNKKVGTHFKISVANAF